MVYMSGTKATRNQSSLVNRTNNCGGVKKAGTGPSVGSYLPSNPNMLRVNYSVPKKCTVTRGATVQRVGYMATLG